MPASIWVYLFSLAYAGAVTLATRVLVRRRHDRPYAARLTWLSVSANLLWLGLMFVAGLLVYRYAERLHHEWWFYVSCCLVLTLVSLAHARLLARMEEQWLATSTRPAREHCGSAQDAPR